MATERERRLAGGSLGLPPVPATRPKVGTAVTAPAVFEFDADGTAHPYFSDGKKLNKHDYSDFAENGILLSFSTAAATGLETAADAIQGSLGAVTEVATSGEGSHGVLFAGMQLLVFSALKLGALWLRANGTGLLTGFFKLFSRRRK